MSSDSPATSTSTPPVGVILTGGMGTRLKPLTPTTPKSLVPVLNRPLIAHGLDLMRGFGVDETVVVVGGGDERTGPTALDWAPEGMTVTVAVQEEPRGLRRRGRVCRRRTRRPLGDRARGGHRAPRSRQRAD